MHPGAGLERVAARAAWRRAAGPQLADRLPLLDAAGEVWTVALPGPTWQAELPRLEAEILPRLRQLPAGAEVRRLAGVLAAGQDRPAARPLQATAVAPAPAPAGSSRQRLAELARRLLDARRRESGGT